MSLLAAVFIGLVMAWFWRGSRQPRPTMACVDVGTLKGRVKDSELISKGAAGVASSSRFSVVVDKRVVLSGVPDVTAEVEAWIRSGKTVRSRGRLVQSRIGVIDERKLRSIREIRQARSRYEALYSSLKLQLERAPTGERETLKNHYNVTLGAFQEKEMQPLLASLERTVKGVAVQKGLTLVLSRDDVLYGGIDITSDVLRRVETSRLSGSSRVSAGKATENAAVVNIDDLVRVHPSVSRLGELEREIEAWRTGRYGIAETLLSREDLSRWEKARNRAEEAWEKQVRLLSLGPSPPGLGSAASPPRSAPDTREMTRIQAELSTAFQHEMAAKARKLDQAYRNQVREAEAGTRKALKAYADELSTFRNRKLEAKRKALLDDLQKRIDKRAADLQEEYLQSEKKLLDENQGKKLDVQLKLGLASGKEKEELEARLGQLNQEEERSKELKQEELRKEMSRFQAGEFARVSRELRNLAGKLDREAVGKIQRRRDDLLQATREALVDQRESLRLQLKEFQKEALVNARNSAAKKLGKDPASLAALVAQGKGELVGGLEQSRQEIELRLRAEEEAILSRSKAYQQTVVAIKEGDTRLAREVIRGLERERKRVLEAIRVEIVRRAEALAKSRGIRTVLTRVAANVDAVDLTRDLARELKP